MRMLITCSDARIQSDDIAPGGKGEVFVLRNAGNIIPNADDAASGSEAATIELAVEALGIDEIILCGHSDCGAMKALVKHPDSTAARLPSMISWLKHASRTKELISDLSQFHSHDERLNMAIDTNVMVQFDNLLSHPSVAKKYSAGSLKIRTLVYELETGVVRSPRNIITQPSKIFA